MNDIRRTILWVIFGFSMVLLWDQWQLHNGKQATFFPNPAVKAPAPAAGPAAQGNGAVPAAAIPSAVIPAGQIAAVPPVVVAPVAGVPREKIVVATDVLRLTFDSEGGSLIRTEFVKYKDMLDKDKAG